MPSPDPQLSAIEKHYRSVTEALSASEPIIKEFEKGVPNREKPVAGDFLRLEAIQTKGKEGLEQLKALSEQYHGKGEHLVKVLQAIIAKLDSDIKTIDAGLFLLMVNERRVQLPRK